MRHVPRDVPYACFLFVLTDSSFPPVHTVTSVSVHSVDTSSSIETRVGSTLVHIYAAVFSREPWFTSAAVIVDQVHAVASIGARFRQTVVDLLVTQRADKSWHALTTVLVDEVNAGAAVQTGVAVTVVHVRLTVVPGESRGTDALVGVDLVDAGASVPTGVGRALVDFVMAVDAGVAGHAVASVSSLSVLTASSVVAWLIVTGLGGGLAMCSMPVLRALTHVAGPSVLQTTPSLLPQN